MVALFHFIYKEETEVQGKRVTSPNKKWPKRSRSWPICWSSLIFAFHLLPEVSYQEMEGNIGARLEFPLLLFVARLGHLWGLPRPGQNLLVNSVGTPHAQCVSSQSIASTLQTHAGHLWDECT